MLSPEVGKLWFTVALMLILVPGALLLVLKPGSAEAVLSVATLILGILFLIALIILIRRSQR